MMVRVAILPSQKYQTPVYCVGLAQNSKIYIYTHTCVRYHFDLFTEQIATIPNRPVQNQTSGNPNDGHSDYFFVMVPLESISLHYDDTNCMFVFQNLF